MGRRDWRHGHCGEAARDRGEGTPMNVIKEKVTRTWWQKKEKVRDKRKTAQSMEANEKPGKKNKG